MKIQTIRWLIGSAFLTIALSLAACGGANNANPTNAPPGATARRTVAPTRATGGTALPTSDSLDDSQGSPDTGGTPLSPEQQATQDQLDDSSGSNQGQTTAVPSAAGPQIQDGKIVLADTLWNLDKDKQIYRFCKTGRWDVLQGGSTVIKTGTFQSDGANVTVKNNADQKTTKYQIAYQADAKTLALKDGATTLTLTYTGPANCK